MRDFSNRLHDVKLPSGLALRGSSHKNYCLLDGALRIVIDNAGDTVDRLLQTCGVNWMVKLWRCLFIAKCL